MTLYYAKIKKYYNEKLYTIEDLSIFVKAGFISESEKAEILECDTNKETNLTSK